MAGVLPRGSSRDHRWRRHQFGKDYQCRDCGKVLSCYTSLKLHQLNIHNGLFQFSCPLCGKGLRRERDLRGHMASRHNMQKEFKCHVCGKEFGYSYTLKDHLLRIHNTVPPQCIVSHVASKGSNWETLSVNVFLDVILFPLRSLSAFVTFSSWTVTSWMDSFLLFNRRCYFFLKFL